MLPAYAGSILSICIVSNSEHEDNHLRQVPFDSFLQRHFHVDIPSGPQRS